MGSISNNKSLCLHRLVCHAVAGCMRGVLQDWNLMVTQLEHQLRTGKLTLQVMAVLLFV